MKRKIIHIDMDAFFAAVEQRDAPQLKGKAVIVGGKPDSRGVVAASSYEARQFGIYSAMPCSRAYQLCPDAVFVRPRFSAYKQVSAQIHEIFSEYTNLIEPLSLDEAYLDVSEADFCQRSASLLAKEIREKIYQKTRLTASAGISYNKFLAKLGSDQNKPNGQFVIKPGEAEQYLHNLPIGRFYGIGKVTEAKLKTANIHTGGDLKKQGLFALQKLFGSSAEYYYSISRGIDNRPVTNNRIRKSLGSEITFQQDLSDINEMKQQLTLLLDETLSSLSKRDLLAYTFTIKVKYADFKQVTRSYTCDSLVLDKEIAMQLITSLLKKTDADNKPVRLLGISFSNLIMRDNYSFNQLPLF